MFLEFYQLREQPFGVTPDPRYLYFSPTHREALASLFYGIETGRGFLALLAEPGMGKTTLLFQLLERLKDSVRSAFLFNTQCDSRELLRYLLDALGLDSRDQDLVRMHGQLNEFLFREALAGRRVVLVIDEAQNLSDSALETVRLLSDFEAPDKKLLQIVLAGQPELAHRLLCPGLGQLRQRIAVRARLDRLPAPEAVRYINHRLQVAGYDGPELFTPPALTLIAERSQGIPRNINNICFNALSLGCATGCKKIGPEIVQEAAADLSFDALVPRPQAAAPVTPSVPAAPQFPYSTSRAGIGEPFVFSGTGEVATPVPRIAEPREDEQAAPAVVGRLTFEEEAETELAQQKPHRSPVIALIVAGMFLVVLVGFADAGWYPWRSRGHETVANVPLQSADVSAPRNVLLHLSAPAPGQPEPVNGSEPALKSSDPGPAEKPAESRETANAGSKKPPVISGFRLSTLRAKPAPPPPKNPELVVGIDSVPALPSLPPAGSLGTLVSGSTLQPSAPKPEPRTGGGLKTARLISSSPPAYPPLARSQRVEGDVTLDALIDATGRVTTIKVVSGPVLLQQAAVAAVHQWKYEPATLDSRPVPIQLAVTVKFRLR